MMKAIVLLAVCAMAAAYTDIDDSLNVEQLIEDVPTLKEYVLCYLDKRPCSNQNQGYRKHFLEAITDGCRECNDRERHMLRVFLTGLKRQLPNEYNAFKAKYDPDRTHFDAAEAAVQPY